MPEILLYVAITVVSTAVVWKGSGLLESSSGKLAAYYRLPEIVQGALVAAVGSSFPELSTAVLSTLLHGRFELGVAAIVGSAIFNILVIPAVAALVTKEPLEPNRDVVYKEAQFYMISVAVLLLTFAFAAIYNPVSRDPIVGEVDRTLALIPVCLYGLYVFMQYQDVKDQAPERDETVNPLRQWGVLAASLALILVGVEGLVRSAIAFGEIFDTPDFLWGVTVVAAGTSVPDAFYSARAARAGNPLASLANVLGSNVFDLLVAILAGVLIAGTATIDFSVAAPMMGVLTLATIVLFAFLRTDMVLSRREGWALLALYALFVLWMVLESFGVTSWVL